MDDPLRKIAEEIVDGKGDDLYPELREQMIADLMRGMEQHINTEIVSRMTDEQADDFVQFMAKTPSDQETVDYLKGFGIDLNDAVAVALRRFKDAYVGA